MRDQTARRYVIAGALAIAFAAVPVGAAWSETTLYACVNRSSGWLRMVPAGTPCHRTEAPLSWGMSGPAGAPGPAGPPGPSGPGNIQYVEGGMYPNTSVARAFCPAGTKVIGGGGFSLYRKGLQQNHPISDADGTNAYGSVAVGWQVAAEDFSDVQAFVVCAGP